MRHYLDLIPISAKVHKKQSRMTRFCIMLSVFLVTTIFGMADMEIRTQKIQAVQSDGGWQAGFFMLTQEQEAVIKARPEVKDSAWYSVSNYGLDKDYVVDGVQTVICGFEPAFLDLFPVSAIVEGSYPQDTASAVVTKSMKERLDLKVGSQVELALPGREKIAFTVSGFTGDTSMLTDKDAFGLFLNREAYEKYFLSQDIQDPDGILYVTFRPMCKIQKTLEEIRTQLQLEEKQVTQNTKLLGLTFQSKDPYMMQLYATALALAVLVMVAGILMIAGSLNSNIAQRTQFFGMMRCLGATKKQVIRFVRREALSWCKSAIPLGILAGTIVIWGLCAILRILSPGLFQGMPVFAVSWLGIGFGAVLGFLTVLLAARAPAKKASGVSPVTAVSDNAGTVQEARKAANTRFWRVETALGFHHAKGSRKNFILMAGSFAFSIVLFLAFSSAVDFMGHAITPLNPYTPDVSVSSQDASNTLSKELVRQLQDLSGVRRIYGRGASLDMQVEADGKEVGIHLISYEENQFDWAEDLLLEGEAAGVREGSSVFAVYDKASPLTLGSRLTIEGRSGTKNLEVTGILSSSPLKNMDGVPVVICSEALFCQLTGEEGYAVIDLQVSTGISDQEVSKIRRAAGDTLVFSDRRQKNNEARGAYYSMALFIYGFLAVIALISVFNIVNSVAMSVSARMRQYGAMRAIGMSDRQLVHMVWAEAVTYAGFGILLGCVLGLPINKFLFESLVTFRWGDAWYLPIKSLSVILSVIAGSVVLAVWAPARRIRCMSIVDTISAE